MHICKEDHIINNLNNWNKNNFGREVRMQSSLDQIFRNFSYASSLPSLIPNRIHSPMNLILIDIIEIAKWSEWTMRTRERNTQQRSRFAFQRYDLYHFLYCSCFCYFLYLLRLFQCKSQLMQSFLFKLTDTLFLLFFSFSFYVPSTSSQRVGK